MQHVLVVLGGRSGTSATTGLLGLLGAALPRRLMQATDHNRKGHFEPVKIAAHHDRLLADMDSAWNDERYIDETWFESSAARQYARDFVDLFREEFGDAPLCVLKEPRMARLLPLWRQIFSDLGCSSAYLFVRRHPFEVASSLRSRDNSSIESGLSFYLRCMLTAEHETRSAARAVLAFGDLLADWRGCVLGLRRSLAATLPLPSSATEAIVDQFIEPKLASQNGSVLTQADASSARAQWALATDAAMGTLADDPADVRALAELDSLRATFDKETGAVRPHDKGA